MNRKKLKIVSLLSALTLLVVPIMYDIFNGETYKAVKNEDIDISDIVLE